MRMSYLHTAPLEQIKHRGVFPVIKGWRKLTARPSMMVYHAPSQYALQPHDLAQLDRTVCAERCLIMPIQHLHWSPRKP